MSGADDPLVDLVVEEPGWEQALPDLGTIAARAAELALEAADVPPDSVTIALLACDDARIAALNGAFRGKAGPTNVLSWPAFAVAPAAPGARPGRTAAGPSAGPPAGSSGARTALGDVAIALETVVHEAAAGDLPLKNHVLHLILHGCLHLLGYDHERQEDAELMEGLERRALARVGVPDPYA